MASVVGVRFENAGKLFYFDVGKLWPEPGSYVIVETEHGQSIGQVITGVKDWENPEDLKSVVRIATPEDLARREEIKRFEEEAGVICRQKIEEHNLEMKLVGVEQTFDNAKLLFYFTANGRVDFRALVKDLASVFHTRIELRQIGVRDEAKMLGGLGPCGRPLCCGSFLGDFQAVGIKMAKEQNLSLNPTKISGVCGRLMCCLTFEQEHYERTRKRMPRIGREVETPEGRAVVTDINVLKETVTVRINKGDAFEQKDFPLEEVKWQAPAAHNYGAEEGTSRWSRRLPPRAEEPMEDAEEMLSQEETLEEPQEEKDSGDDWMKAVEEALHAAEKR